MHSYSCYIRVAVFPQSWVLKKKRCIHGACSCMSCIVPVETGLAKKKHAQGAVFPQGGFEKKCTRGYTSCLTPSLEIMCQKPKVGFWQEDGGVGGVKHSPPLAWVYQCMEAGARARGVYPCAAPLCCASFPPPALGSGEFPSSIDCWPAPPPGWHQSRQLELGTHEPSWPIIY